MHSDTEDFPLLENFPERKNGQGPFFNKKAESPDPTFISFR